MTRQNKAIQKRIIAKQFTALHLQGQKGPKATTPLHGKKRNELAEKRRAKPLTEGTQANQNRGNRDRAQQRKAA
jgi:hypothetical protein